MLDATINLFSRPGLKEVGRAEDVNTIDEVPDSNWFTNRAGTRPITADELFRGPSDDAGPAPGKWTVSQKANGVTPGFTITDERNRRYFVKFDSSRLPGARHRRRSGRHPILLRARLPRSAGDRRHAATRESRDQQGRLGAACRTVDDASMRFSDIDDALRRAERNRRWKLSRRHC